MIREVTMYVAVCDRCGHEDQDGDYWAWAEADQAETVALESDWQKIGDRLVCHNCWTWSEDGEEIIEQPQPHPVQEQQT